MIQPPSGLVEKKKSLAACIDNQLTAFATEPVYGEKRKLFKRLQLCKSSDFVKGGAACA